MHTYPFVSQTELSDLCGIHDPQVMRQRLRRAGVTPCMIFGSCKLYARDRIAAIKVAVAPRRPGPASGPRLSKHNWKAAAALVADWRSRSEICALVAEALGLNPTTIYYSARHFSSLAAHLERDPESRKYRVKQETTNAPASE